MPQLEVSTYASQVVWLCVCFGVLYAFVTLYFLPRIRETLERRLGTLEHWREETRRNLQRAEELSRALDAQLAQSEREGFERLSAARRAHSAALKEEEERLAADLRQRQDEFLAGVRNEEKAVLRTLEQSLPEILCATAERLGLRRPGSEEAGALLRGVSARDSGVH